MSLKNTVLKMRSQVTELLFKVAYKIKPRYASDVIYYHNFHKWMDLENPRNLVEKIHWLLYKTDTSLWTLCADKYRMREYVASKGLEEYLPKLYGHWENPDKIDFNALPNEFVLKSNNGCGTVKIVQDKSVLDIEATKKLLKSWLKPYGYFGGQTHYLRIKPCIIAEELLHQSEEQNAFSPHSLVDYKVWCFNGIPECILVIRDRVGDTYQMGLYDTKWRVIPNGLKIGAHYRGENVIIPKPECLEELLEVASRLSQSFVEVRVDLYVINSKPIIGELTFTAGYPDYTDEFIEYLGSKIDLSKVKKTV